jgi:protein-S-isoprenylcysteine O-methyltransferase Ste14
MQVINRSREKRILRKQKLYVRILTCFEAFVIFSVFAVVFCRYYYPSHWTTLRIVGLIFSSLSFLLWLIARLQLGVAFSYQPKAITLVTTGLYSKFSHPIYLFSFISLVGYILLTSQYHWFYSFVFLLPIQWYRITKESKVLHDRFQHDYEELMLKVWF